MHCQGGDSIDNCMSPFHGFVYNKATNEFESCQNDKVSICLLDDKKTPIKCTNGHYLDIESKPNQCKDCPEKNCEVC